MVRLSFHPQRTYRRASLLLTGALFIAACRTDRAASQAEREADAQRRHIEEVVAAGGVVDSVLPVAEALRRFRADLPAVDTLRHASPSIADLVARLSKAVAANDTADLNAMQLDRAEFAWLFYEDSPLSKPPYEAPPGLLWGQILMSSDKGAKDLVRRFGGSAVRVSKLSCPAPEVEGRHKLYKRCTVEFSAKGRPTLAGNLFGTVIERDGRFKLVSFANRI